MQKQMFASKKTLASYSSGIRLARCFLATQAHQPITSRPSFNLLPPSELGQKSSNILAGRKYLPGSWSQTFPKVLANPRVGLPHALSVENADKASFRELGRICRKELDVSLPHFGAVLFRGMGLSVAKDFSEFTKGLGYEATSYEGGTGNRHLVDEEAYLFTSTDDPMDFNIELHNEMACSTRYPKKVIFCCIQAPGPANGGLTPIARNSEVFSSLDPKIVEVLQERKIRYLRYLPDVKENQYTSWQQSFLTQDRQAVEQFLKKANINFEWDKSNNSLRYWYVLDALVPHPVTGQPVWFNQPDVHHNTYYKESPMFEGADLPNDMYPTHATYGNGSEIETDVLRQIRDANWSNAVGFQWKNGDVIVIDNILAKHARLSFKGERKILSYLTKN